MVLPRFRSAFLTEYEGELQLRLRHDSVRGHPVLVASLRSPLTCEDLATPELLCATLQPSPAGGIRLTGFERIQDGLGDRYEDFAQDWLLEQL